MLAGLVKWLCLIACTTIIIWVGLYVAFLAGVYIIYGYVVLSGG